MVKKSRGSLTKIQRSWGKCHVESEVRDIQIESIHFSYALIFYRTFLASQLRWMMNLSTLIIRMISMTSMPEIRNLAGTFGEPYVWTERIWILCTFVFMPCHVIHVWLDMYLDMYVCICISHHVLHFFIVSYIIILQFYHVILRHYAYMRYYGILVDICVDHLISHSIRFTYASFCYLS